MNGNQWGRTFGPQLEFLIALCLFSPAATWAQEIRSAPADEPAQRCSALSQINLEGAPGGPAVISSSRLVDVPAAGLDGGLFTLAGFGGNVALRASKVKRYCNVTGYVAPQNKFELRLPLQGDWNQKFLFSACGGYCGVVNGIACNPGLARGYASATSNGGHDSSPGFDGVWAANAPNLQEDYGWRSNHVVTLVTKFIVAQYYGQPIQHSYMTGCSKGGQAVLLEAQKFPEDYDGLIPIAPVYDFTGRSIAASWFAQAVSDGRGGSVLNVPAAEAIHKSVLKICGAQAGVDEGLVTDPVACKWQPEMIACASGSSGSDCLTPEQVSAVKRLMTPVKNAKGEVLYAYPYIPGSETEWAGLKNLNYQISHQYQSYLADEKPRKNVDPLKFDFDKDPATLARSRRIYDATSYDLRAFKARRGKMLLWHGLADGGIMATSSIGYYEGVMKLMGGRQKTEDFFRLYLIPGVHHCGGGPGLTEFDALTLLENWVENGQAPEALIAARRGNDGRVERSRPVYPYPKLARYSGSGDPKQTASFVPVDIERK
jgi:hypothetical protein